LKLFLPQNKNWSILVAPYAGAWIEISPVFNQTVNNYRSLPTRERGLK